MTLTDNHTPAVDMRASLTPVGATFNDTMTIDEWASFGEALERQDRNLRWIIGDWMLYGSDHYGARAAVIADALNLASGTVANAASVCRRVPLERRRQDLSFGHHENVAHLDPDDQMRLLEVAAREGLSVSVLRQVIRDEERTRRELHDGDPAQRTRPTAGAPSGERAADPPLAAPHPPASTSETVTLVISGDEIDPDVLADGVARVRDALEQWLAGHGSRVTIEVA